jgi:hypothetical protein
MSRKKSNRVLPTMRFAAEHTETFEKNAIFSVGSPGTVRHYSPRSGAEWVDCHVA